MMGPTLVETGEIPIGHDKIVTKKLSLITISTIQGFLLSKVFAQNLHVSILISVVQFFRSFSSFHLLISNKTASISSLRSFMHFFIIFMVFATSNSVVLNLDSNHRGSVSQFQGFGGLGILNMKRKNSTFYFSNYEGFDE